MKKGFRNSLVSVLIASLAAPSAFLFAPETADAQVSGCLAGIIAGYAKSRAAGTADVVAVPANSQGITEATASTAGQTQGFTVQRCIVEPLVTMMARALLSNFTAQTVRWINSGFKGSPLYVTNPQGFFSDVGNQAVGSFIEGLGPMGKILCSPFDLQLRLALNIQYSSGYYQEIGCRLTDIQQNIQRGFTGGTFGKDGWNNWIQLTAQPQNNVYGAYLKAVDTLDGQIANKINDQVKRLDWGKGFLSSTKCTAYSTKTNASGGHDCTKSEIETPGSVIEDQLNKTLAQPLQNIGLAKDIDAILNALVGQMINQVIGPGGLLGGSRSPSGGGQSAVDYNAGRTTYNVIAANRQTQNLPAGILPSGMTPDMFCTAFKNNLYYRDKTNNTIKAKQGVADADGKITYSNELSVWYKGSVPATIDDYNGTASYCRNIGITAPATGAADEFNSEVETRTGSATNTGTIAPRETPEQNLAINQEASQSGFFRLGMTAEQAVNGDKTGYKDDYSGHRFQFAAISTRGANGLWWKVKLEKPATITSVRIYKGTDTTYPESLGTFVVKVYDGKGILITQSQPQTPNDSTPIPLSVPINAVGQEIKIERTDTKDNNLYLSEVEVLGKRGVNGQPLVPSAATPSVSFSPETIDAKPKDGITYNLVNRDFQNSFTLAIAKSETGLKARIKFLKATASGAVQGAPFATAFATNTFAITGLVIDTDQSSFVFNDNFGPTAGQSFTMTETGRVSETAVFNTVDYPSYRLVMELFKVTDGKEEVIATQTTTFKIQ